MVANEDGGYLAEDGDWNQAVRFLDLTRIIHKDDTGMNDSPSLGVPELFTVDTTTEALRSTASRNSSIHFRNSMT